MKNLSFLFALFTIAAFSQTHAYDLYDFDDSITLDTLESQEIRTGAVNKAASIAKPYVILVSLDGFRHDYPMLHHAENIQSMMKEGSYIKKLIPCFPSKTFPNHYSIATGMYPATHGLVSNSFFSREKQATYTIGNREAVRDGKWYGGTPLWVLAEQQGMLSASFFWVGSEASIQDTLPAYSFQYNSRVPYELRIDQVQKWLQLPEQQRPHLIFLYYSLTDSAGHRFGPTDEGTGKAVRYVDNLIGKLRNFVHQSDLPINLIVTADHGMTPVSESINVGDFVDIGESQFEPGPMAMIYTPSKAETDRIYQTLQKQNQFRVYLGNALPSYLHYYNPDRIGDIVMIADAPATLDYEKKEDSMHHFSIGGTHGYDPYRCPDMGAIFVAEGPNIRKGQQLSEVENIHIYPFIASILDLEMTQPIDGKVEQLAPLLKKD